MARVCTSHQWDSVWPGRRALMPWHIAQPRKTPPPGARKCCATVVHLDSPDN